MTSLQALAASFTGVKLKSELKVGLHLLTNLSIAKNFIQTIMKRHLISGTFL